MDKTVLGILGGSGVYDIAGLENARWKEVESPWGKPSGAPHVLAPFRRGHGVFAPPRARARALADEHQQAAWDEDIPCQRGGTYLAMEGPQFSSLTSFITERGVRPATAEGLSHLLRRPRSATFDPLTAG